MIGVMIGHSWPPHWKLCGLYSITMPYHVEFIATVLLKLKQVLKEAQILKKLNQLVTRWFSDEIPHQMVREEFGEPQSIQSPWHRLAAGLTHPAGSRTEIRWYYKWKKSAFLILTCSISCTKFSSLVIKSVTTGWEQHTLIQALLILSLLQPCQTDCSEKPGCTTINISDNGLEWFVRACWALTCRLWRSAIFESKKVNGFSTKEHWQYFRKLDDCCNTASIMVRQLGYFQYARPQVHIHCPTIVSSVLTPTLPSPSLELLLPAVPVEAVQLGEAAGPWGSAIHSCGWAACCVFFTRCSVYAPNESEVTLGWGWRCSQASWG